MKLFISFSGARSRTLASVMHEQIPNILDGVEPFMSKHDIAAGTRWASELAKELQDTNFGVLCITRESLDSPWMNFEAGALSKHIEGRACTLLFGDLRDTDITGPLAQFQHCTYDQEGFTKLIADINEATKPPLPLERLKSRLEKYWPDVHDACSMSLAAGPVDSNPTGEREDPELLKEVLSILRDMQHHGVPAVYAPAATSDPPTMKELASQLIRESRDQKDSTEFVNFWNPLSQDDKNALVLWARSDYASDIGNSDIVKKMAVAGFGSYSIAEETNELSFIPYPETKEFLNYLKREP